MISLRGQVILPVTGSKIFPSFASFKKKKKRKPNAVVLVSHLSEQTDESCRHRWLADPLWGTAAHLQSSGADSRDGLPSRAPFSLTMVWLYSGAPGLLQTGRLLLTKLTIINTVTSDWFRNSLNKERGKQQMTAMFLYSRDIFWTSDHDICFKKKNQDENSFLHFYSLCFHPNICLLIYLSAISVWTAELQATITPLSSGRAWGSKSLERSGRSLCEAVSSRVYYYSGRAQMNWL